MYSQDVVLVKVGQGANLIAVIGLLFQSIFIVFAAPFDISAVMLARSMGLQYALLGFC